MGNKTKKIYKVSLIVYILYICISGVYGQNTCLWKEDFSYDIKKWKGRLDAFYLQDGMACSNGRVPKDTIFLMRSFSENNELQLREDELWDIVSDSGLSWSASFKIGFNPSSANYLRFYLWIVSSERDLFENTDSYAKINWEDSSISSCFLQLGEKGGNNTWSLYKQNGKQCELIWKGLNVFNNKNGGLLDISIGADSVANIFVMVKDKESGLWVKDGENLNMKWNDFFPDSNMKSNIYTGFYAAYNTASRASLYYIDEIKLMLGKLIIEEEEEEEDEEYIPPTDSFKINAPTADILKWSEILFETETGGSKFFELYNNSDSCLSPLYLFVGVKKKDTWKWSRLCKDTNTVLLPNSYSAWCKDKSMLSTSYYSCSDNIFDAQDFPTLDVSSGNLLWAWFSHSDTIYGEEMYYDKNYHHVLLASTKGVSLERIGFKNSAMDGRNWQSASIQKGGATPACENTQYNGDLEKEEAEMGAYFSFSSKLISPNSDGINDYVQIRWNPSLQGFVCSIDVYDSYGRKVCDFVRENILGAKGEFTYKGYDNKNLLLRPGIYVFYIQLVHPQGKRKKLRYAIAVG